MKGHGVATVGLSLPLRGFAGDGDLVIAVARLVADHGTGASLTRQAVAHGVARGFAFDCEVKLSAAAGGITCHSSAPRYSVAKDTGLEHEVESQLKPTRPTLPCGSARARQRAQTIAELQASGATSLGPSQVLSMTGAC
jgi:hypothetical protein